MKTLLHLKCLEDYNKRVGYKAQHPLISIIDLSKVSYQAGARALSLRFGFYAIFLKKGKDCTLKYGRHTYDYQEGTLVFIGPDQVVDISSDGPEYQPSGTALLFHQDLFLGTSLAEKIKAYSFFSYQVNEALHLSNKEQQIIKDCINNMNSELHQGIDKHSKNVIVSNLELLLNYCTRFYDRQFITRDHVNRGAIKQFDILLSDFYKTNTPDLIGLPSVAYFAEQMNLSSNYFGDLIKKETGITAKEHIQCKVIDLAKELMYDTTKSVSEIAFELGFKYPQHFTRLFKKRVGYSPKDFRASLN